MAILEREAVAVNAATYVAYYRRHMARDETDLFPRVEDCLSNADLKAVSDAIPLEADPLFRPQGQAALPVIAPAEPACVQSRFKSTADYFLGFVAPRGAGK